LFVLADEEALKLEPDEKRYDHFVYEISAGTKGK
jgi:hypothetical protein